MQVNCQDYPEKRCLLHRGGGGGGGGRELPGKDGVHCVCFLV